MMHDQELFLQANQLYTQKEYQKAYDTYDKMSHKGSGSWYNMGNCAYHINNYVQARACWQRSCKGASWSERRDAEHNMQHLEQKLGSQHRSSVGESLLHIGEHGASFFSLGFMQIFFLVIWLLLFLVAKRYQGKKRYGILVGLLVGNIIVSVPLIARYIADSQRYAVVAQDHVILHAGPDEQYHNVGSMQEHAQVKVHEVRQRWCKVQCGRLVGWVPTDALVIV